MTNAIAMNSTMFNIATVVGPSVAGLTYAFFGPAWCFTLNGISFIAVIVALLLMRIVPTIQPPRRSTAVAQIAEGLRYTTANRLVASLTVAVGLVSFFAFGLMSLLPAWATDVLHGNEITNGLLISARGVGALVSALLLASMVRFGVRGKYWINGVLILPITLFVFAWVRWLPLSLVALAVVGWSMMMITNNSNAIIQSVIPDELRGRVMGIYALVFNGSIPLGALLAGAVAQKIGSPITVTLSAAILFILAIIAWVYFPDIRRHK
jgi:predicted MFS family arabinose efflux permease